MRESDRKKLWGLAGGRCSICERHHAETPLVEAHIVARKESGFRGDAPLPLDQRDQYDNRILLCPNCHATIDTDVKAWPVERLKQVKAEHEGRVRLSGGDVTEVAGTVEVEAPGGDDVAGLRIRRATRIKPGTRVHVDAPGARRVTGVETGGSDE